MRDWCRFSVQGSAFKVRRSGPHVEPSTLNPAPCTLTPFYTRLLSSSASYLFTSEIQQLPAGVFLVSQ